MVSEAQIISNRDSNGIFNGDILGYNTWPVPAKPRFVDDYPLVN